jgi:hypothetical protein
LEKSEVDEDVVREVEDEAATTEKSSSPADDEDEDDEGEAPNCASFWTKGCDFVGGVSVALEAGVDDEAGFEFAGGVK